MDIEDYITKGTKTSLWTAYRKIFSNHENMKVELDMLEEELTDYDITEDKIKKIIESIELWLSKINNNINELNQAREDFRNRKMIEELNSDGRGISSFFG